MDEDFAQKLCSKDFNLKKSKWSVLFKNRIQWPTNEEKMIIFKFFCEGRM